MLCHNHLLLRKKKTNRFFEREKNQKSISSSNTISKFYSVKVSVYMKSLLGKQRAKFNFQIELAKKVKVYSSEEKDIFHLFDTSLFFVFIALVFIFHCILYSGCLPDAATFSIYFLNISLTLSLSLRNKENGKVFLDTQVSLAPTHVCR